MEFVRGSGRSAAWFSAPALGQEGAVATNKEQLLARRREGEAAGPAVQMGIGCIPIFRLVIGNYLEFVIW